MLKWLKRPAYVTPEIDDAGKPLPMPPGLAKLHQRQTTVRELLQEADTATDAANEGSRRTYSAMICDLARNIKPDAVDLAAECKRLGKTEADLIRDTDVARQAIAIVGDLPALAKRCEDAKKAAREAEARWDAHKEWRKILHESMAADRTLWIHEESRRESLAFLEQHSTLLAALREEKR